MSSPGNQRETRHLLSASVEEGNVAACKAGDSCRFWGAGVLHFVSDEDLGTYSARLNFLDAGCETCAAPDTLYPEESGIIMTYSREGVTDMERELADRLPGATDALVRQLEYMTARNEPDAMSLAEQTQ